MSASRFQRLPMHANRSDNQRTLTFPESVFWWSLALAISGALFGLLTTGEDGQRFLISRAVAFSLLFVSLELIAVPLRWLLEKFGSPAWLQWVLAMAVLIGVFRFGAALINGQSIAEATMAGVLTGAITGGVIHRFRRNRPANFRRTSSSGDAGGTVEPNLPPSQNQLD